VPHGRGEPNWELIPFAVSCPRCGLDLRGARGTACPICALELDWEALAPIEHLRCPQCAYRLAGLASSRCPECGRSSSWSALIVEHQQGRLGLLECQRRGRSPAAAARAWWIAMSPARLWRRLDIYALPSVRVLLVIAATAACLFAVLTPLCLALAAWILPHVARPDRNGRLYWQAAGSVGQRTAAAVGDPLVSAVVLGGGTWMVCSLAALLVFAHSMRRYRVRASQVVRVWLYACVAVLPVLPVLFVFLCVLDAAAGFPLRFNMIFAAAAVAVAVRAAWSIHLAYRHYLRMDRSPAVALAAQVVAVLAAIAACNVIVPTYLVSVMYALTDFQVGR